MEIAKRYLRQVSLSEVGSVGQQKLRNAKVLVIGAGGLGCPVLQMLAASGVGTLGIVDGDIVEETNLHRQLLFSADDCGRNKVNVAAEAIQKLNPEVETHIYPHFIGESNIAGIIKNYDILVDCTDNIATRYLINDIAVFTKKPMVYASIHKCEGQVSVFNYKNGPTYRCLFPEKESSEVPNCVTSGVLGVLPNTLGMLQASEVLKMILGIGKVLSGRVLIYDALEMSFNELEFTRNDAQIETAYQKGKALTESSNLNFELDKATFLEKCKDEKCLVIDLREAHELPKLPFGSIVSIPFSRLAEHQSKIKKEQQIIVFCQSGLRSKKALELLINNGFTNVQHLQNGVQSLKLTATN